MDAIIEIFNQFWAWEYKWYAIAGVGFLILLLIVLIISGKSKRKKRKLAEKKDDKKSEDVKPDKNVSSDADSTEKVEAKVEEKPEAKPEVKPEEKEEAKVEEKAKEKPTEKVEEKSKPEENVEEKKVEEKTAAQNKKFDGEEKVTESKYVGKWIIRRKSLSDFVLYLTASNGEVILTSESYANIPGAHLGLQTLKKNIALGRFQIHSDKNNHYFFKLKDSSNKLLGLGQVYTTRKQCNSSISSVKRFSQNSELVKNVYDDMSYIEYVPREDTIQVENIKDAYRGKWIITNSDNEYQAKLIASNGEVLLVTERYASVNSVYNAIETIKTNAAGNNFIIDCDKNKKYFYRLRNSSRLTLCIGEAYDTKASCINSIESVKRFCLTAGISEE